MPKIILLAGGACAVAAAVLAMRMAPSPVPAVETASIAPSALADPGPLKPEFDIVRVSPGGSAVLAGRAAPGAQVTVMEAGKPVGEARADARGAWMMVPAAPLKPGATELSVASRSPAGTVTAGDSPVLLVVPPADARAPVLAVVTPRAAPARVLQAPEASTPGKLGLDTADYDDHGAIRFTGTAPAYAPLRLYVDTAPAGDATADGAGHWALAPVRPVEPGVHTLRLEHLMPDGRVASRLELPFLREAPGVAQISPGQVVVQPGQNLWRLARRAYGEGIRYTVIYQANQAQIRDPRLIYIGQVFTVPSRP